MEAEKIVRDEEKRPSRVRDSWNKINWHQTILILAIIGIALLFNHLSNGIFLSQRNISLLLRQSAILTVVASGMVVLMVSRQIDLSVGSAIYFINATVAMFDVRYGYGFLPTMLIATIAGLALGAWQGVLVSRLRIPAFVATLAGMLIFRGTGYVWTNAGTIGPTSVTLKFLSEGFIPVLPSLVLIVGALGLSTLDIVVGHRRLTAALGPGHPSPYPKLVLMVTLAAMFTWVMSGFNGISMAVLIMALAAAILSFIMGRTKFGRNLYVIGGNPDAALMAGINIKNHVFYSFLVMGAVYAVAGILMTSRLASSSPAIGTFLELDAIAAAVIGGTSLMGGVGTIPGALMGALLLTSIDNGMSLMNVSSFLQMVTKGLILLTAVSLDLNFRKR